MIESGLAVALVALSTLCTALYLGLGFLPRPSRAAATWSCALAGFMIASYAWIAADTLDSVSLQALASGLMVSVPALLWAGLRARRRADGWHWYPVAAVLLVNPAVLVATSGTEAYALVVGIAFVVMSIFAALTLAELIRIGHHLRDEVLPLAMSSGALALVALLGVAYEAARLAGAVPDGMLPFVGEFAIVGALAFVVCATVTLLLLTRQQPAMVRGGRDSTFAQVARDRLRRAQAADDRWWAVLVVRLDDPLALREASSTNAFDQIRVRFVNEVTAMLPAEADLDMTGDVEITALLPRPEGAVRQLLARLLERIAAADSPLTVRLSASVGWAGVDVVGYDLDELTAEASDAATRAEELGGDRWHRVSRP